MDAPGWGRPARRIGLAFGIGLWLLACSGGADGPAPSGPLTPDRAVTEAKKIVAAHRSEPLGLCEFDTGWGYAALRVLDQSTDRLAAAESANRDSSLAPLTRTDLFVRWYQARTVPLGTDDELKTFLRQNSTWYDARNGAPRRLIFRSNGKYDIRKLGALGEPEASGEWGTENDKLWIETESGRRVLDLEQGDWSLEMNIGVLGIFLPEPMTGKC